MMKLKEVFVAPNGGTLTRHDKVRNCIKAYLLMLLVAVVMIEVLRFIFNASTLKEHNFWFLLFNSQFKFDVFSVLHQATKSPQASFWVLLFLVCAVAPTVEEMLFRDWPLTRVQAVSILDPAKTLINSRHLVSTVFFSSIIFGLLHGSVFNLFIQGIGGLVLCWLFLKNKNSYWSVVLVHAAYNITVTIVSSTVGSKNNLFLFLSFM